jgi:NAD(P)-dependent dehydrogenase (short-subunit alcohol dehydrogenase family)
MVGSLHGKTYIVTGASRGIGLATAKSIGRRGGRVALFGRDKALLARGAADVGKDSVGISVDLTDPDALIAAVDEAAALFGGLDGIVNNAALNLPRPIEELRRAEVNEQLSVNFLAQVYGCSAAIPHIRRRGGGRIVNVSSTSVSRWDEFSFISIYAASKAAVERFTLDLREEVKPDKIGVTLFCPGSTATSFGAGGDPEVMGKAFETWINRSPMFDGRMDVETVGETLAHILELPVGHNIDFLELSPNRPTLRRQSQEDYANLDKNP